MMTKRFTFLCFLLLSFSSCVVEKGKTIVDVKKKFISGKSILNASVSSVQIINNQLVVTGTNLSSVTVVKVDGNSLTENFTIESKSTTQIIANSMQLFAFDVSKVFSLILSDANASATFAIDFSLCNATLNGRGFDCSVTANNKEVLSFDTASNKWKPRALNGLSYKGAWDAGTAAPVGAATGDYYIVSDPGGIYSIGDWSVYNGSTFDKIDNSTVITNVFGRTGAVLAQEGDYSLDLLLDVDLSAGVATGKVLKYDGSHWVASDDLSGGGAGSVVTSSIANSAVTDAKIATVSASKITGTLNSTQILDGTIVNADINAAAAIDYSKLNIPNATIPYAKLNIADGDIPYSKLTIADGSIPYAKITGGPAVASILAASIADSDTTHAPDGNSVFDALGTKLNTTGGTLTVGTINGVPTPSGGSDIVNKSYTDTQDALKVSKAGDTMSGALSLNANLNLRGTTNYVTIAADSGTATYTLTLPSTAGTNGYVLSTNGSGILSWISPGSGAVTSSTITDGTIVDADINASAAIAQSKIANLTTDLAGKEPTITGGTAAQYLKGNKSLGTFASDVLATLLAGLSTATNAVITTGDSVIDAFGKLQKQITDLDTLKLNKTGGTLTVGTINGVPTPTNPDQVVNKSYVDSFGHWAKSGSDISYSTGNVGIGITTPENALSIGTLGASGGFYGLQIGNASSMTGMRFGKDGNNYSQIIWGDITSYTSFSSVVGGTQYNEAMVIKNANVGIGTNNPGRPLHVVKQTDTGLNAVEALGEYDRLAISGTPAAGIGGVVQFGVANSSNTKIIAADFGAILTDVTPAAEKGALIFRTANAGIAGERMRIDSSGNVGIGETNPTAKLHVNGAIVTPVSTFSTAFTCGTSAISFATSNFQRLSPSGAIAAGTCNTSLTNMVAGGSYTLVVTGNAATNAVTYNFTGYTFKYLPTNAATTATKDTIYTFIYDGTTVYVTWSGGY